MKVKDVMTNEIIVVDKDVELNYVLKLMKKHNITKIPVLEEKKLVGLITDNIIAKKLGAIRTKGVPPSRLHASSVTDKEVDIVSPDDKISDILKKVGEPGPTILTVIENGELVGVVTKADLLPLVNSNKQLKDVMTQKLITVSPEDRIIHARRQMINENVARIPVCENGKLIGMISDNEIVFALARIKSSVPLGREKHQLEELLVKDAMKSPAIWARPNISCSDGAKLMMKHHVGALPLIEEDKLIGIVTRTDLIKTVAV